MDTRLKRREDFDLVFKKGNRVFSDNLTMLYIKSKELKIGYSVGKKHGGSVQRNRIKRLLRASFFNKSKKIKDNYYIVFLPKVKEEYTYQGFMSSMDYLLKKSGILK